MSITRTHALRAGAIAVFGLLLGAALAVAAPVSTAGSLRKSPLRKAGSAGARTFGSRACVSQGIACNTTVSGELSAEDCLHAQDQTFYDAWTFAGVAGESVQISMNAAFDTVLWLYNSRGDLVAFNDDIDIDNNNLNSRITFVLTETDTYTIWANSYSPDTTGPYSLDLQCPGAGSCTANATSLCLNGGRFRVDVIFSAPSLGINDAPAQSVPLTSDTGYFWFFSSNNVELVIKVVDGRAFNQHYWVFYGALSDVQYTITVTDTVTGAVKTYTNPQGHLASVADVAAFPTTSGTAAPAEASEKTSLPMADFVRGEARELSALSAFAAGSASAICLPDATTLCLNGGRFQVRVTFDAPSLGIVNGSAQAAPLTSDTGYFWFFSSNNVELVIKAVDGRAFNQFFWVFYGALSDVHYTITVSDSETGAVKTYSNPQGQLASVADVAAFR